MLKMFCARYGEDHRVLETGTEGILLAHAWPGNVRELRNAAERSVLLSHQTITPALIREILGPGAVLFDGDGRQDLALPNVLSEAATLREFRRQCEKRYIAHILALADGVRQAAQALGVDRSHLYQKMKDLGLGAES